MLAMIADRRSIRRYKNTPVPRQDLEKILYAASLAPSSKNRQPWRFVVAAGEAKASALQAMENGLERETHSPFLPGSAQYMEGARQTLSIMEQAPVIIFIINPLAGDLSQPQTAEERVYELCNAQSIGACLENMALTAESLGLGSLWICDTYFAQEELGAWLGTDGQLAAAMALGYPDEAPLPRPRQSIQDLTEWRT